MEIVYLKPDDLIPYENNTKIHPPEQVKRIAESIKRFGWQQPIVVDRENVVIIGHGRLMAAKQLMLDSVPVVYADNLTEEEAQALRLADNKTNESPWDFSKLEEEIAALSIAGIDMTAFGFDDLSAIGGATSEATEDEPPEIPEEPKAKRGEIYRLGNHRLMCGDSTSREDVEKLMDGENAVLLLTDPPYGINVVGGGGGYNRNRELEEAERSAAAECFISGKVGGGSMNTPVSNRISPDAVVPARQYKPVIGDETTETARKNYEIVKDFSENQIIFGGNYFTDFLSPSRCWVVWDKENTGNFADAELAWTSFDKGVKLYHFMWNGLAREGSRKVEGVHRVHPTQKPVGMLANILKDFSEENDLILDCFGGSGSTLLACEQTGRKCFMMELDPHYIDVIIKRWEDFTGQKAELLKGAD